MKLAESLYHLAKIDPIFKDKSIARVTLEENHLVDMNGIDGIEVSTKENSDSIDININILENAVFEKPVHFCVGVLKKEANQRLNINLIVEKNAKVEFLAHCIFPTGEKVLHQMDAKVHVKEGANLTYLEKHIHSEAGGVTVIAKADVLVEKDASYKTIFEFLKGAVGNLELDYKAECKENATLDMLTKVYGKKNDVISIRETGRLTGKNSKGVLKTRVAAIGNSKADVYNDLLAAAEGARGHVDCHEIIEDNGQVSAVPVVKVTHPKAHVTHEAAIGSVDTKQLETLLSRGMEDDEAINLIIQSLLN